MFVENVHASWIHVYTFSSVVPSKLLGLSRLPDLEELQKNLSAYLETSKLEKEVAEKVKK